MAAFIWVASIVVLLVCPAAIYCSNVTVNSSTVCCGTVNGTSIDDALGNINSGDYLRLLSGCHCVRAFKVVKDVTDVSLIGDGDVQVTCAPGLGLAFLNVTRLSIQGLTITGCGLNGPNAIALNNAINETVDLFIQLKEDINVAVVIGSCTDVVMDHVTITNTTGIGLVGVNVAGQSNFTNNQFSFNKGADCFLPIDDLEQSSNKTAGGGAQLIYVDYVGQNQNYAGPVSLNVDNSTFSYNSYCGTELLFELDYLFFVPVQNVRSSYYVGGAGGLTFSLAQRGYSVTINVRRSIFTNNTATLGSAAAVLWFSGVQYTTVVFSDCNVTSNGFLGLQENGLVSVTQGGIAVIKDVAIPRRSRPLTPGAPNTLTVLRTAFTGNVGYTGSCMHVLSLYSDPVGLFDVQPNQIILDSCRFENNSGNQGAVFLGAEYKATGLQSGIVVTMQRCVVVSNTVLQPIFGAVSSIFALVQLLSMNVTIGDTTFANNNGTSVGSLTSLIILKGTMEFSNNFALVGGAMHLSSESFLLVKDNSRVKFTNNTAYLGGAIYVDYSFGIFVNTRYEDCFMYFGYITALCTAEVPCPDLAALNISVAFSNNVAFVGGSLYGSTLDSCSWATYIKNQYSQTAPVVEVLYNLNTKNIVTIMQFDQNPNTTVAVSTPTNALDISGSANLSYVPGQQFNLYLRSTDRLNHTVPTVVTPQSKGSSINAQLGSSGFWLTSASGTSAAQTKVYGEENTVVYITLYALDSYVQSQSLGVNLSSCGFGFRFNKTTMDCECSRATASSKVKCDSNLKVLNVTSGSWLGPGPGGVGLVYARCLLDYCADRLPQLSLNLHHIDAQCADNRAGLLCGGCQEGYSVAFGTNRCMKCSNDTLALLLFFAAAGIGIIAIILFLHITVAEGYITGVVFYSGVVVTYATVQGSPRLALLPLYFLNLNIGFETCFYDGMTPLARAGLGLVFPTYLFVLMILFIWLAGRFLLLSEWLASNNFTPSKLVATLIILSYNSITQSCFQILGFVEVTVYDEDGKSQIIRPWGSDPNVGYFSPEHTVLFLISVILLIVYVIPVPVLLILPTFTSRGVWRFKPLYDVFFNPFKENFTFWLGVCLIIRIVIFTISSFFGSPDSTLYLGVVLMIAVFLKSVIQPFKFPLHNALDVFFLINLLLISLGSLYNQGTSTAPNNITAGGKSIAFLFVVVGVAYLVICGIIVWHFFLRFSSFSCKFQPTLKSGVPENAVLYKDLHTPASSTSGDEPPPKPKAVLTKPVTFSEVDAVEFIT